MKLEFKCWMKKRIIFVLFTCLLVYYMFGSLILINTTTKRPFNPVKLEYVVVHLDLKGAPPKLKFLKSMLQELKRLGANALLIEYEDTFPYENELKILRSKYHYLPSELESFLRRAAALGIEVIPLIQTFGHMEFVLKHKEFSKLKEDPDYMDSICPTNPESLKLIDKMLRQVIEFHESIAPLKHIHIGCDEVFHIARCNRCREKNVSHHTIFLSHVENVSKMVWSVRPKTTVLIWDDMLRSVKPAQWTNLRSWRKIQPVYWSYHGNNEAKTHLSLFNYHLKFQNLWIAPAFKGADGREALIPNYEKRTENILNWLYFIQNYKFAGESDVYEFKGIILTGWSRYTHFQPLCELLAVSYKSLITHLLITNQFRHGIKPPLINWEQTPSKIFDTHFREEYYKLVGEQHWYNSNFTNILDYTLSLYDTMDKYSYFSAFVEEYNEHYPKNYYWCLKVSSIMETIENNLSSQLTVFYNYLSINFNYYKQRNDALRKYVADCIVAFNSTSKYLSTPPFEK